MEQTNSDQATHKRPRELFAVIGRAKIVAVVDDFYDRIQKHPALAEPFQAVQDWEEHKARLSHFWWISLGGPAYRQDRYRVADKHAPLGVTEGLISDWLKLFRETLLDHLPAELAEPWLARAGNMGISLRLMSDYYDKKTEEKMK